MLVYKKLNAGVGLYGEEGSQAAMSSDYACGDFKCLRRLVLFHGRLNYLRIGEMILYFFFKNFIFTIPQFFFAFYSGFSGMTLYDDWYVSLYNILFTALPLTVKALFEKDIIDPEEHLGINSDNNFVSKQLSYTYYVGRESMIFNMERLSISIIFSLCYSVMVFFAVIYYLDGCIAPEYGYVSDFWVGATTQFTAIIFVKFN
jgi:magnesium-transporting ATPase (P-type)